MIELRQQSENRETPINIVIRHIHKNQVNNTDAKVLAAVITACVYKVKKRAPAEANRYQKEAPEDSSEIYVLT